MLRTENEQFWQFNSFFKKTTWRPRTCASDDSWVESKRIHIGLWYQLEVSCLSSILTKNWTLYLIGNLAEIDLFARGTYLCPCIRAQEANSGTYRGSFERQYQGEEMNSWCSCLACHLDLFHHQKRKCPKVRKFSENASLAVMFVMVIFRWRLMISKILKLNSISWCLSFKISSHKQNSSTIRHCTAVKFAWWRAITAKTWIG